MTTDHTPARTDAHSDPRTEVDADPWSNLRRFTPARIALGRAGASLPTREVLGFTLAHAQARDAIHLPLDVDLLAAQLQADGWPAPLRLHSRALDRHQYLLRPDLGRRLDEASVDALQAWRAHNPAPDLALVVGDGLSALGIQRHTVPLFDAIRHALGGAFVHQPGQAACGGGRVLPGGAHVGDAVAFGVGAADARRVGQVDAHAVGRAQSGAFADDHGDHAGAQQLPHLVGHRHPGLADQHRRAD